MDASRRKETEPLAMDNMQNRPIKHTNNWQSYSVVLDIKEGALGIAFGVLLSGEGCVWLDSIRFDEVDEKFLQQIWQRTFMKHF